MAPTPPDEGEQQLARRALDTPQRPGPGEDPSPSDVAEVSRNTPAHLGPNARISRTGDRLLAGASAAASGVIVLIVVFDRFFISAAPYISTRTACKVRAHWPTKDISVAL